MGKKSTANGRQFASRGKSGAAHSDIEQKGGKGCIDNECAGVGTPLHPPQPTPLSQLISAIDSDFRKKATEHGGQSLHSGMAADHRSPENKSGMHEEEGEKGTRNAHSANPHPQIRRQSCYSEPKNNKEAQQKRNGDGDDRKRRRGLERPSRQALGESATLSLPLQASAAINQSLASSAALVQSLETSAALAQSQEESSALAGRVEQSAAQLQNQNRAEIGAPSQNGRFVENDRSSHLCVTCPMEDELVRVCQRNRRCPRRHKLRGSEEGGADCGNCKHACCSFEDIHNRCFGWVDLGDGGGGGARGGGVRPHRGPCGPVQGDHSRNLEIRNVANSANGHEDDDIRFLDSSGGLGGTHSRCHPHAAVDHSEYVETGLVSDDQAGLQPGPYHIVSRQRSRSTTTCKADDKRGNRSKCEPSYLAPYRHCSAIRSVTGKEESTLVTQQKLQFTPAPCASEVGGASEVGVGTGVPAPRSVIVRNTLEWKLRISKSSKLCRERVLKRVQRVS